MTTSSPNAGLLLPATLTERLEAVYDIARQRAWAASTTPGALVIDVDSTICEVAGKQRQEFIDGPPSWRSVVVDSDRTTCALRSEAGE